MTLPHPAGIVNGARPRIIEAKRIRKENRSAVGFFMVNLSRKLYVARIRIGCGRGDRDTLIRSGRFV